MRMPKALFLPSYAGGGFGHIGRCLALAASLQPRGWEVALALGGPHVERAQATLGPAGQVYALQAGNRRTSGPDSPVFTVLSSMNYQLLRDGLVSESAIRQAVAEGLKLVHSLQPQIILGDASPLAGILGRLAGVPVVQIVRSIIHPAAPQLIWWQSPPAALVAPNPQPVFNPLLRRWGLPAIYQAEDLLWGDLYLVPSFPELDPLPAGLQDTVYVGPLTRPPASTSAIELEEWLAAQSLSRPLVYVTTGGGAEGVGSPAFYRMLLSALQDMPLTAVVSTGARLSPDSLPAAPAHVKLVSWAPGPALIARSQLVVYSGGYGTTMEMVQAGTPGLVIPAHTEQESNARRLEQAGMAQVLLSVSGEPHTISGRWPGGQFAYQVYPHSSLTADDLRQAILGALACAGLKQNALRLQAQAATYGGPQDAAANVEALLQSALPRPALYHQLSWWQKLRLGV